MVCVTHLFEVGQACVVDHAGRPAHSGNSVRPRREKVLIKHLFVDLPQAVRPRHALGYLGYCDITNVRFSCMSCPRTWNPIPCFGDANGLVSGIGGCGVGVTSTVTIHSSPLKLDTLKVRVIEIQGHCHTMGRINP